MKKESLHIGINGYENAPLKGCLNDALDWNDYFVALGFNALLVMEETAVKDNIINNIESKLKTLSKGDVFVMTFSGHGTQVTDQNGDESDGLDECLVPYDYLQGNLIYDDELNNLCSQTKTQVVLISDSCHSGSVSRFLPFQRSVEKNARFIKLDKDIIVKPSYKKNIERKSILFSGCKDNEYSYDANIDGRANGALTANMLKVLKTKNPKTYNELYGYLKKVLPSSEYPQSPQFLRPKGFLFDDGNKKLWT